jgi:hypothetical protein
MKAEPASREARVSGEPVTGLTFSVEDRIPPTVSITAPEDGTKTGASVTVVADAKDNVKVTKVTLRLNDAQFGEPLSAPPFTFPLSARDAGYRSVKITVVAEDAAGHVTESEAVRVRFFRDRKGPEIHLLNPEGPRMKAGKTKLLAEVGDDSGVSSVTFEIDGKAVGKPVTRAPFEVPWEAREGTHSLVVTAVDALGNETRKTVRFRVR